jgi:hypothetical protein
VVLADHLQNVDWKARNILLIHRVPEAELSEVVARIDALLSVRFAFANLAGIADNCTSNFLRPGRQSALCVCTASLRHCRRTVGGRFAGRSCGGNGAGCRYFARKAASRPAKAAAKLRPEYRVVRVWQPRNSTKIPVSSKSAFQSGSQRPLGCASSSAARRLARPRDVPSLRYKRIPAKSALRQSE